MRASNTKTIHLTHFKEKADYFINGLGFDDYQRRYDDDCIARGFTTRFADKYGQGVYAFWDASGCAVEDYKLNFQWCDDGTEDIHEMLQKIASELSWGVQSALLSIRDDGVTLEKNVPQDILHDLKWAGLISIDGGIVNLSDLGTEIVDYCTC